MKPIFTIGLPSGTSKSQFESIKTNFTTDPLKDDYHVVLYTQIVGDNWKFEIVR